MKTYIFALLLSLTPLISFNAHSTENEWYNSLPDTFFGMKGVNIKITNIHDEVKTINSKNGYPLIKLNHGDKIKIENNRIGRIQAILSVDGKNILTGKKATLKSKGKIVMPGDDEYFVYNNENETLSGYISVAIFFEKENYPIIYPHMEAPPNDNKYFLRNDEGVKIWIPPKEYHFRKINQDYTPNIRFYLNYKNDNLQKTF